MAPVQNISTEWLHRILEHQYGLTSVSIERLPWGADADSIPYRVHSSGRQDYFLKLRLGNFDPISLTLPRYLHDQGIPHIIPPMSTQTDQLWVETPACAVMLYPFVDGQNGFVRELTDVQWEAFGRTLRAIHDLPLPSSLLDQMRSEAFSPIWRDAVVAYLDRSGTREFRSPLAERVVTLLQEKRPTIMQAVSTADRLAQGLSEEELPLVNCHYDLHAGNILLTSDHRFYLVDWDNPIRAPRERDLMFIGAGIGGTWNSARESELFYRGYGPAEIHLPALAYYRVERVVEDLAAYAKELLTDEEPSESALESYGYLEAILSPDEVLKIAFDTADKATGVSPRFSTMDTRLHNAL